MASDQTTDLILRLEELENRVRVLEDTDAIRNLKARYAAYCDDNYNPDKIAELFVEDAVWESGPLTGQHRLCSLCISHRTPSITLLSQACMEPGR